MIVKPIPEWRTSWRMFSVQAAAVAVLFGALPVDQQAALLGLIGIGPERIPALMGLAVIIGRLVDQPRIQPTPPAPAPAPQE